MGKYQLVVQFKHVSSDNFDELVDWEEALADHLTASANVDGHDLGAGEFNVFVFTDNATVTFSRIQRFVEHRPLRWPMAAAYREFGADNYVVLWPPESTRFEIA